MTTLAIIGSGIAGRSLIYTLAKEQKSFEKITLFASDEFAFPCSLHSTAIVAPRGLSAGHSPLGDLLMESFKTFKEHVELDKPKGVQKITQYTGATSKLEAFKSRYPNGTETTEFLLNNKTYVATEEAFLIDPKTYLDWLLNEALVMDKDHIEVVHDFVTNVDEEERVHVKTQNGRELTFDKVIFTTGSYSRYWKPLAPESKLKTSKSVQGSYLEFNNLSYPFPSFSMTLDGHNLIWNASMKRLLVGSTTLETHHVLAPLMDLREVYDYLQESVSLELPKFEDGEVKVGLREKAQKRGPYLVTEGRKVFLGGFYKNGFSLALKMTRTLSHQNL